jgi:hypothetical protein
MTGLINDGLLGSLKSETGHTVIGGNVPRQRRRRRNSLLLLTIGIWLYEPENLAEALGSRGGLDGMTEIR